MPELEQRQAVASGPEASGDLVTGRAGTPHRIPSLDGLRAVAIVGVILGHSAWTAPDFPFKRLAAVADESSHLGVRLFFVISGFLITSLLKGEYERKGQISLSRFYFRRALRIFPACYALVLFTFALSRSGFFALPISNVIRALTYTSNFNVFSQGWPWLVHTWSLAVEEQFYLAWPALLCLLGWKWSLRGAGALIAGIQIARLLLRHVWHDTVTLQQWPAPGFDEIAWGCLLAGGKNRLEGIGWYRRFLSSKLSNLVWAVPILTLAASSGDLYLLSRRPFGYLTQPLAVDVCLAFLVHRCVTCPQDLVGKFLNCRPVTSLGRLSYSLYLWQEPFLNPLSGALVNGFPMNLTYALACTLVSYRFIEKPFLALRERLEPKLFPAHRASRDFGIGLAASGDPSWMN
jgi:peptidoglycan/LPS O-acetylase OafA/YrhL